MDKCISGVIKWYGAKSFGFLVSDEDNREVFFHLNDCDGFVPREGTRVEFAMGLDRNGRPKATKIKSISVCVGVSDGKEK